METAWQDLVIAAVQAFFCVNMIPMIRAGAGKDTPLFTSVTTFLGLVTMGAALLTIPLYYSALTCSLVSISWGIIAYQRIRATRSK